MGAAARRLASLVAQLGPHATAGKSTPSLLHCFEEQTHMHEGI